MPSIEITYSNTERNDVEKSNYLERFLMKVLASVCQSVDSYLHIQINSKYFHGNSQYEDDSVSLERTNLIKQIQATIS